MKPLSDFMIWHSLRILRFAGWCSMAAAGDRATSRCLEIRMVYLVGVGEQQLFR
jgi:hypothetical protein